MPSRYHVEAAWVRLASDATTSAQPRRATTDGRRMLWHLTAHALTGSRPLESAQACNALWAALRRQFPDCVAAVLMPDHVHLLVEAADRDEARRRLAQCLAAFARQAGLGRTWQPVPQPAPIRDSKHLARQIRYVHLNPCRAGLADDPLCWLWSTHRGAVGLELDPWVSPARLAALLRRREADLPQWLHSYVSGDPSVHVEGTPLPIAAAPQAVPLVSLADIASAASSAVPCGAPRRHQLLVQLALHQGWRDADLIARAAGISVEQVRRLKRRLAPGLLRLGALHLADPRLRQTPDFTRRRRH
jgi:REP element-mobilizing transposase RayT